MALDCGTKSVTQLMGLGRLSWSMQLRAHSGHIQGGPAVRTPCWPAGSCRSSWGRGGRPLGTPPLACSQNVTICPGVRMFWHLVIKLYLSFCEFIFVYLTVGNISYDVLEPLAFQKYTGCPKKMQHSDFSLRSVLEVQFNFFTCVTESEFWARSIWAHYRYPFRI